jgi:hypothetical protein
MVTVSRNVLGIPHQIAPSTRKIDSCTTSSLFYERWEFRLSARACASKTPWRKTILDVGSDQACGAKENQSVQQFRLMPFKHRLQRHRTPLRHRVYVSDKRIELEVIVAVREDLPLRPLRDHKIAAACADHRSRQLRSNDWRTDDRRTVIKFPNSKTKDSGR